jgi:hypothetical protein
VVAIGRLGFGRPRIGSGVDLGRPDEGGNGEVGEPQKQKRQIQSRTDGGQRSRRKSPSQEVRLAEAKRVMC